MTKPTEPDNDTQWHTYEVFSQKKRGDAHVHVGAVHAPDPELALMLARDQFSRREKVVQLWVVQTEQIISTTYDEIDSMFEPMKKDYREAANFKVGDMIRGWEKAEQDIKE